MKKAPATSVGGRVVDEGGGRARAASESQVFSFAVVRHERADRPSEWVLAHGLSSIAAGRLATPRQLKRSVWLVSGWSATKTRSPKASVRT